MCRLPNCRRPKPALRTIPAKDRRDRRGQRRPQTGFGRSQASATPDADAVDLCVAQIHSANACGDFLRVNRVMQLDTEVSEREALVTAEIEMKVLSPFTVCSPVAVRLHRNVLGSGCGQAEADAGSRQSLRSRSGCGSRKPSRFGRPIAVSWRCNTRTAADRTGSGTDASNGAVGNRHCRERMRSKQCGIFGLPGSGC